MQTYGSFDAGLPVVVLGHGAGAGEAHPWMRGVAEGLASRGFSTVTFDFPYVQAGRRAPDPGPVLEAAFSAVWREVADRWPDAGRRFAGGKSMGGRIATQAAARGLLLPAPAGLVCFGYPLHPPGKPETRRDRHLAAITVPILFLHGSKDPFGTPAEMTELVDGLPGSSLYLVDAGDHSLERTADKKKPKSVSLAAPLDRAASWMSAL